MLKSPRLQGPGSRSARAIVARVREGGKRKNAAKNAARIRLRAIGVLCLRPLSLATSLPANRQLPNRA
jgi:hypothetical protein